MTNDNHPTDAIQQANPLAARITDAVEDLYGMNHITREEVLETIEEELGDIEPQLARAMKVVEAAKAWNRAPNLTVSGTPAQLEKYSKFATALVRAIVAFDAEAGKGEG